MLKFGDFGNCFQAVFARFPPLKTFGENLLHLPKFHRSKIFYLLSLTVLAKNLDATKPLFVKKQKPPKNLFSKRASSQPVGETGGQTVLKNKNSPHT